MSTAIISTQGLTRRFGATVAVDGLTLAIEPGEIFGFLGHNGAGKTTTIRLLNGVLAPTSGEARVFGLNPQSQGPAVRQRTGVLTETPALDDRLTALESLRFAADLYGTPLAEVEPRIQRLLATFELAGRAHDRVAGFSKGMRQRLALARTLIHDPELLCLDEPTAGLDPVATRQVHNLITRLARDQGRTVLLCTHNLVEAQRLCQRVAVLAQGRLLAQGTPAELARQFDRSGRVDLRIEPAQASQVVEALRTHWSQARVQSERDDPAALTLRGLLPGEIPALVQTLVAAGVAIYSIAPAPPSLEEVYLALQDQASWVEGQ